MEFFGGRQQVYHVETSAGFFLWFFNDSVSERCTAFKVFGCSTRSSWVVKRWVFPKCQAFFVNGQPTTIFQELHGEEFLESLAIALAPDFYCTRRMEQARTTQTHGCWLGHDFSAFAPPAMCCGARPPKPNPFIEKTGCLPRRESNLPQSDR